MINDEMAAIIGVVVIVIVAVVMARKVGFKLDTSNMSLFATKKDSVSVEAIDKSKIDIENREGQDITVKDVSNDSHVKIK